MGEPRLLHSMRMVLLVMMLGCGADLLVRACQQQKCDCGGEIGSTRNKFSEMLTDVSEDVEDVRREMKMMEKSANGGLDSEVKELKRTRQDFLAEIAKVKADINEIKICTSCPAPTTPSPLGPAEDCYGWWLRGHLRDGVYTIKPKHFTSPITVYCDMRHEGWIVWQRRFDGSVNFTRNWRDHKFGFGRINGGEFWLGNEVVHKIVEETQGMWDLRIDVTHSGKTSKDPRKRRYSVFDEFRQLGEQQRYTMGIKNFLYGDAGGMLLCGDRWGNNTGQNFTTFDRDHDNENELTETGCSAWKCNCARLHRSGWWHNSCFATNLNFMPFGEYSFQYRGGTKPGSCDYYFYYMMQSEMKIRKSKQYLRPS